MIMITEQELAQVRIECLKIVLEAVKQEIYITVNDEDVEKIIDISNKLTNFVLNGISNEE